MTTVDTKEVKNLVEKPKAINLNKILPPETIYSRKFRKLFGLILNSTPILSSISDCDKDGEIKFSVLLKEIGVSYEDIKEFKNVMLSNFFADFLGELLVRENINSFVKKMTAINSKRMSDLLHISSHLRFGMKLYGDRLEFAFHISLLQNILTEDFKRQIWRQ